MSKATTNHLAKVSNIPCLICKRMGASTPAEVHHIRDGQGMSQRAQHWLTIPLCPEHHRGGTGLHGLGTREFERRYKVTELDLLAETIERLSNE